MSNHSQGRSLLLSSRLLSTSILSPLLQTYMYPLLSTQSLIFTADISWSAAANGNSASTNASYHLTTTVHGGASGRSSDTSRRSLRHHHQHRYKHYLYLLRRDPDCNFKPSSVLLDCAESLSLRDCSNHHFHRGLLVQIIPKTTNL